MGEDEYETSIVYNKPASGMWHNGPNSCWITVTHKASGQSVRAFGRNQHKTRQSAMVLLELLIESWDGATPQFIDRLNPPQRNTNG